MFGYDTFLFMLATGWRANSALDKSRLKGSSATDAELLPEAALACFTLLLWLAYMAVDMLVKADRIKASVAHKTKMLLVVGAMAAGTLAPAAQHIHSRMFRGGGGHDGGITITEAAATHLLRGVNPYSASYAPWLPPDHEAIHHYPYGPMSFLLAAPGKWLAQRVGVGYDNRLLYVTCFLWLFASCWLLTTNAIHTRLLAIGVGLNPVFGAWVAAGENDVLMVAFLIAALVLATRSKTGLASIAVGLAVATKQHAVLFAVPWLLHLAFASSAEGPGARPRARRLFLAGVLPCALGALLPYLPFLLSSARDVLDDNVLMFIGMSEYGNLGVRAHPSIWGLSRLLVCAGLVQTTGSMPGWATLLMVVGGASATLFTALAMSRHREALSLVPLGAALLVLAAEFPGRQFSITYVGFMLVFLAYAWFADRLDGPVVSRPDEAAGLPGPGSAQVESEDLAAPR